MPIVVALLEEQNLIIELVNKITEKKEKQIDTNKLETQIDKIPNEMIKITEKK